MDHRNSLPLLIGCLLWALPPFAVGQAWTPEVTNLRGIQLGIAFFATYKECPKRLNAILKTPEYWPNYDRDYPAEFRDVPCFKTAQDPPIVQGSKVYEIDNLPFIQGAGRTAKVTLVDDSVQFIEFTFLNSEREQFYAAMIEKYGRPSKEETRRFQNALGQTFVGRSLRWSGSSVTLLYDEYQPGQRDWGAIRMMSRLFERRIEEWAKSRRENVRRGL